MNSLRICNLRSLEDTGEVEIRPITLLLGRNSSGKSTLLRLFPLLKQSVEQRTEGPILWYGPYVDFGSFEEAVADNDKGKQIGLSFRFDLDPFMGRIFGGWPRLNPLPAVAVDLGLAASRRGGTVARRLHLEAFGHNLDFEFDEGIVSKFLVNGDDVLAWGDFRLEAVQGDVLPIMSWPYTSGRASGQMPEAKGPSSLAYRRFIQGTATPVFGRLERQLGALFHGKTSASTKYEVISRIEVGSRQQIAASMKKAARKNVQTWHRRLDRLLSNEQEFASVVNTLVALAAPTIVQMADHATAAHFGSFGYVAPLRAAAERYYRRQDLAVSEVDAQGENLAVYLRSLSDADRRKLGEWTERAFGWTVRAASEAGHISLRVREGNDGERNLADLGFGFSQLVPFVVQVWDRVVRPRTSRGYRPRKYGDRTVAIAIEQPELHLHPALQARVADMLVSVAEFASGSGLEVRFLVETHSPEIVNRIGNRIALARESRHALRTGETISAEDVTIAIFERNGYGPTKVRQTGFTQNGVLRDNWPFGFFDPDLV